MAGFRFLFFADCQLGAYATFSGLSEAEAADYATRDMKVEAVPKVVGHDWDAERYAAAVQMANHMRPDFVIVGGDMIDDPAKSDQVEALLEITGRLDRDIPILWAPGNHDIASDFLAPTAHDLDKYREIFGPDYYSFDRGPATFVVMNTVLIDHPERVPDEFEHHMEWLAHTLDRAAGQVILIGHHPLFLESPEEPDTYWNLPLARRQKVLELAERARVELVLAGHWHRNSIARAGRLEMVTSGPVGYPLGSDPSGFRIVDVRDDGSASHRYQSLSL